MQNFKKSNRFSHLLQARIIRLWKWFFTLFFRLLYHPFAWSYDLVANVVSVGAWKDWVKSSLPFIEGLRVLELGFGPGHLQQAMAEMGVMAYGIDESWPMVHRSQKLLTRPAGYHNGYAKSPRLVRGLAQALPFPASSFHTVVTTFPAPYILDPQTLAAVHRVLVPQGRLVMVLSAQITGQRLIQRAAAGLFTLTGQTTQDASPFIDLLHSAGFEVAVHWLDLPASRVLILAGEKGTIPGAGFAQDG